MRSQILVATPSKYRREWYRTELETYDFEIAAVNSGIECIEALQKKPPHALILESSLRWGGADGVLTAMNESPLLRGIPVVLVAVDGVSTEEYRLARFTVQGYFSRVPFAEELATLLQQTIRDMSARRSVAANQSYQVVGATAG